MSNYTPEQAAFARDCIQNWCARLQISPRQMAEETGVDGDRVQQFITGVLPELEAAERAKLEPLFSDFVQAEEAEEREYRLRPSGMAPRNAMTILREHMNK